MEGRSDGIFFAKRKKKDLKQKEKYILEESQVLWREGMGIGHY